MNKTLFVKECKSNMVLWIIFAAVLTVYSTMIVSMFDPKLGDSLKEMAQNMPDLFAAFGMLNVGTTLLESIIGYLYGLLLVAFPGVFIIILANRLVARYVDKGAMAYLLSAPVKRRQIAVTQLLYLVLSILLLVLYIVVVVIFTSESLFKGELEIKQFMYVNIGLFGLLFFFGGFCFCVSCIFDDTRYSLGISSGVVIASILIQMISQVGDKFEKMKYATPLTLFDANGLAEGTAQAMQTCAILYAAGIAFSVAGVLIFSRRNISV